MLEVKVQFYFEENKVSRNKIVTSRVSYFFSFLRAFLCEVFRCVLNYNSKGFVGPLIV